MINHDKAGNHALVHKLVEKEMSSAALLDYKG